jgi:methionyl-tRNA formyltransferase
VPARILLLAAVERGARVLEALVARDELVTGVYVYPEDASERARHSEEIIAIAAQHGVPQKTARRVEADDTFLDRVQPDLLLAVGWRTTVPMEVVARCVRGAYLVHDSLLPRMRGFAPTPWAIINGEQSTGVTLLEMKEEVDTGAIVDQIEIPIGPDEYVGDVYRRVGEGSVEVVVRNLDALCAGTVVAVAQDETAATYCCSRTAADGLIDWAQPTRRVFDFIRAQTDPLPGAFTWLRGERLFVTRAEPLPAPPPYEGRIPGRIVASERGAHADVLTGDGVLRVWEVRREAGDARTVAAGDVANSVRLAFGR